MALFPKCSFEILLEGGGFAPGDRAEGIVVLTAPETILRADHIHLAFLTIAWGRVRRARP